MKRRAGLYLCVFFGFTQKNNKKVVLVVGAGDAISSAIAEEFAEKGYTVCLARRSAEPVELKAKEINAKGYEAFGFALDVSNESEVEVKAYK